MKPRQRKSKRRALKRAVRGGVSRLRKQVIGSEAGVSSSPSNNGAPSGAGVLRPGSGYLRLPDALAEAGETEADNSSSWMPGRVVLTITLLAILFIAIITWFVSQMPDK